ncbi:MAG: hypothetical protein WC788_08025 [Candidatus Paceibacterota bacterium]|jgi:hypothetical protein
MEITFDIVLKAIVGLGIPTIIVASVYIGRKLQILDDLKKHSDSTSKFCMSATNSIVEVQTHLASTGFVINNRLAYESGSPLKLTDWGESLMEKSGFSGIMSDKIKRDYLVKLVRAKDPKTNYDIQQYSMDLMSELAEVNDPVAIPLKEYSYKEGLNLEIILNSAGLVLRDEVMKELKFDDKI